MARGCHTSGPNTKEGIHDQAIPKDSKGMPNEQTHDRKEKKYTSRPKKCLYIRIFTNTLTYFYTSSLGQTSRYRSGQLESLGSFSLEAESQVLLGKLSPNNISTLENIKY